MSRKELKMITRPFLLTMWYVKQMRQAVCNGAVLAFLLTMWYVKSNHLVIPAMLLASFLLTMWYVKTSK